MVAIRKSDGRAFSVVFYNVKVHEIGSDTQFGEDKLMLYNGERRHTFEANRQDYKIVDSWNEV